MDVAVDEGRVEAPSATPRTAVQGSRFGAALLGVAGALVCAAVFLADGSSDARLFWIGAAALLAACAAVGAALAGFVPWPRLDRAGLVAVSAAAALVLLTAATILWSVAPDLSWAYANRGLVYVSFLVAGLFVGGLVRRAPVAVAAMLTAIVAAAAAWAIAGKIAPSLFPDGARIARLRAPVGYWNALALLAAMGMPLALWLGQLRPATRWLRALGAVLLYALAVVAGLTYSRGGIVVAAFAVGAWLLIARPRVDSLRTAVAALPAAIAVAAWAFTQPGVVDDLQAYDVRVRDGWQLGVVFAVAAVGVAALSLALERWQDARPLSAVLRTRRARLAGVVAACLAAVAVAVTAVAGGGSWLRAQVDEFADPVGAQVSQDPSRLGAVSSNNRWQWWNTSWQAFLDHPANGVGAGTFELVNVRERTSPLVVTTSPHNLPLQLLSETGIFGFLLLAAFAVAAIIAVRATLRRLDDATRAAAAALAAGSAAYALHSIVDKDWDYVAVSGPFFLALGVLLASGRGTLRAHGRTLYALPVVFVCWAGLYSLSAPYVATRLVDRTYDVLSRPFASDEERIANEEEAVDTARRARSLNPLAVDPLFAVAAAANVIGFETEGLKALERAVELQPENPETWYQLGVYEYRVLQGGEFEDLGPAYGHILRAYELDPYGPAAVVKDELEQLFLQQKAADCAGGRC